MNKLLKDAIADAKAVRETALANAKAALEEAFAPKIQSMLSHKIKEEMQSEVEGEEEEKEKDDAMEVAKMQKMAGIMSEEDDEVSDEEEMPADNEEMPADNEEMPADDKEMPAAEVSDEEEVSDDEELEELLRELELEEAEETEEEPPVEEPKDEMEESEDPEAVEEEIDLEEVIAALREEEGEEEEEEEEVEEGMGKKKAHKMEEELNEAYNVIKFLRGKLSEVNLLNAKLLYVNKLFRKANLTETQKVKIIETFDRAKNVREAKLIYSTLAESVNKSVVKPAKTKMTEGFASAPQKNTKIISESSDVYNRFKTLVNYNKI